MEPRVEGPEVSEISLWYNTFALTSMLLKEGFFLKAITGGQGNTFPSLGIACSSLQLALRVCCMSGILSQSVVANTSGGSVSVRAIFLNISALSENLMEARCSVRTDFLYLLCNSFEESRSRLF